jgi:hypothetical protein
MTGGERHGGGRPLTESGVSSAIVVTTPNFYIHKYNFRNMKILAVVFGYAFSSNNFNQLCGGGGCRNAWVGIVIQILAHRIFRKNSI